MTMLCLEFCEQSRISPFLVHFCGLWMSQDQAGAGVISWTLCGMLVRAWGRRRKGLGKCRLVLASRACPLREGVMDLIFRGRTEKGEECRIHYLLLWNKLCRCEWLKVNIFTSHSFCGREYGHGLSGQCCLTQSCHPVVCWGHHHLKV